MADEFNEMNQADFSQSDKRKERAYEFLRMRYFSSAADLFERLRDEDPNDEDVRFGVLMSKLSVTSREELIRYYQDLFSKTEYEEKIAFDKDEDTIKQAIETYQLDDSTAQILFDYDLTYLSSVSCRKRQKKEILSLIDSDQDLKWLKENGRKEIDEIIRVYDERIVEAEKQEEESIERRKKEYQNFLEQAQRELGRLNEEDQNISEDETREEPSFEYHFDVDLHEQARRALNRHEFSAAYDLYSRILSEDPDDEKAHLGALLSLNRFSEAEEYYEYLKNLYSEDHQEVMEACDEDHEHIESMAEKYEVPGYLEKEEIREKYFFDRTYLSSLGNRIRQKKRFEEETKSDLDLMWLRKNASPVLREQINSVFDAYARRANEAMVEDEDKTIAIKNEYRRFLYKTYSDVKNLYQEALNRKDSDYLKLIRFYDGAKEEEKLLELIEEFKEFGDYKDALKYISLCKDKISLLKETKEEVKVEEISEILEEGNRYLDQGKKEEAKERYSKAASIDPDHPYAYLGLLMEEIGVRNEKELIDHYCDLFSEEEYEILNAFEDDDHIEASCERYAIPGYLQKEEIRGLYRDFDKTFRSLSACRIRQKQEIEEEMKMDPYLSKIRESKDDRVEAIFNQILRVYDDRIYKAKEYDRKKRESIREIYEYQLFKDDQAVAKLYQERLKEKENDAEKKYQENLELFSHELSIKELEDLSSRFDKYYKDGTHYIEECRKRIEELRSRKEAYDNAVLLNNAKELIETRRYDQAKETLSTCLKNDPENEEVHLAYLLANNRVHDVDSLFRHYRNIGSELLPERKEAVEKDQKHIDEICERYAIPGVLEREEIIDGYDFDRSYDSYYRIRVDQKNKIERLLKEDPSLRWLSLNGSQEIKDRISDLLSYCDNRIRQTKEREDLLVEQITKEYEVFLNASDGEVIRYYEKYHPAKKEETKKKAETKIVKQEPVKKEKTEKPKKAEKPKKKAEPKEKKEKNKKRNNFGFVVLFVAIGLISTILGGIYYYDVSRSQRYDEAISLGSEGQVQEAISILEELGNYRDSLDYLYQYRSEEADRLYQQGAYLEALPYLLSVGDKESRKKADEISKDMIISAQKGDTVYFGAYEQDGNLNNDKEPIEWKVIEKQDGNLLLLSVYALDAKKFSGSSDEIYWKDSEIRTWLNDSFMREAFSDDNRSLILQSSIICDYYLEDEGTSIQESGEVFDNIFLFGLEDVMGYRLDDEILVCKTSEYVRKNGIRTGICCWWLRSANMNRDHTSQIIRTDGSISDSSYTQLNGVRPALWVRAD